ncbi:MAG: phospholipid carrier-dependent glycosyltransferase, partial [Cyanobacteriota bacterium]
MVWGCSVALVNPSGDYPLMDDWVYGLVVRNILETGQFRFISPASTNLFTQAYWGALFCLPSGFSFVALRLSTIVLAALGIASLYSIIREIGCSKILAALAALLLIFNPFYLSLANSFMTDVPFTA